MQDAERISAWILQRCRRGNLAPDGFGARDPRLRRHRRHHRGGGDLAGALPAARRGWTPTIDSIGLCLRCLMDHPDQWRLLREDPSLGRAAFEEATRFELLAARA